MLKIRSKGKLVRIGRSGDMFVSIVRIDGIVRAVVGASSSRERDVVRIAASKCLTRVVEGSRH